MMRLGFELGFATMKICWFDDNKLGLVEGDMVSDVSAALKVLPTPQYPAPKGDLLIANLDKVRAEISKVAPGAKKVPASSRALSQPGRQPEQDHRRTGELHEARAGGAANNWTSSRRAIRARSRKPACS